MIPSNPSSEKLRQAAKRCRACPLWKTGTQTVFGSGPKAAQVMLVANNLATKKTDGEPFVGAAGKLLDKALLEAGIDRKKVYLTNVVKTL